MSFRGYMPPQFSPARLPVVNAELRKKADIFTRLSQATFPDI